jgi:hypothetical protein
LARPSLEDRQGAARPARRILVEDDDGLRLTSLATCAARLSVTSRLGEAAGTRSQRALRPALVVWT